MARPVLYLPIFFVAGFAFLAVKAEEKRSLTNEAIDSVKSDEAALEGKEQLQDNLEDVKIEKRQRVIIRPYILPKKCKSTKKNSRTCCAGFVIDSPKRKTCCRGSIVLKRLAKFLCRQPHISANCGRYLYNKIQSQCCHGIVIPRNAPCKRRRCGRHHYITYGFHCCRGKVLDDHVKCKKPKRG